MIDCESIGMRVRYYRIYNGMSQEELAERTKTSRVYIGYIERGERTPSLEMIIDLANSLCISTDDLLAENLFSSNHIRSEEEMNILSDCTKEEKCMLLESMQAVKDIFRRYK